MLPVVRRLAMTDLQVDDFEGFFVELWRDSERNNDSPFPWQSKLVRQVHAQRRWPDLVDLPTGSGKTSLVDIAVFLLALDAGAPAETRWMPRRFVLVVDRRVVVDQAEERGTRIARRLESATDGILHTVAERLRSLSIDGPPLVSTALRGGIVRDETWSRRPDVPAIISSTVDQVGSRLLFRGYGLSPGMRPIHAGLLANDALLLLDEVHLAQPFAQTLDHIRRYRTWREDDRHVLPDRWHVVQLTATPTTEATNRFPDGPLDASSHPILARRLQATKPARLEIVKVAKDTAKANEQLATACVRLMRDLLQLEHVNTAGVIVNRVDTARHVARQLHDSPDLNVVLLTGRMRSLDRDRVLNDMGRRLRLGRERTLSDRPLVVVATQSIEAGADFDLDGIVTECASLDALRQRFGRVDRDGRLSEANTPASSVIAIRSSDTDDSTDDPVYGAALARTWAWLSGLDEVDFGIEAMAAALDQETQASLVPSTKDAPVLFPGHLDQWVQTSQRPPRTEADVARWLHGLEQDEQLADVGLVWRADVDPSLVRRAAFDDHAEEISARIAACPPVSGEVLPVSIVELRRWAAGDRVDPDASDATGRGRLDDDTDDDRRRGPSHAYLRWSRGKVERVELRDVRPGDTLVLPATTGGIWLYNWDPGSKDAVADVALVGALRQRDRAVARLSAMVRDTTSGGLPDPEVLQEAPKAERLAVIRSYLRTAAADRGRDDDVQMAFAHLGAPRNGPLRVRALVEAVVDGVARRSYVVTATTRVRPERPEHRDGADIAPEDGGDAVSFTGRLVTLDAHLQGVADRAERLATSVGIDRDLVDDLRLAARLHDAGKADARFQRWLRSGGLVATEVPLAKSATPDTDRLARDKAREVSGYPRGARHELLSLAMLLRTTAVVDSARDPELVRYLVASHHGHGRYRFPPSIDPAPTDVTVVVDGHELAASSDHGLVQLDAGVPARFWQMVRRYGWFGLAWLEAILRLADHSQSRDEQVDGQHEEPVAAEATT
jgi:CRISPR-associated endonuclease/helicase Cas3